MTSRVPEDGSCVNYRCPICGQVVSGAAGQVEQHVNHHLDESEEKQSVALAEHLQKNPLQKDAALSATRLGSINVSNGNAESTIGGPSSKPVLDKPLEDLTPVERMIRETEESDAALAISLAGGTEQNVQLITSLADSIEHCYSEVLQRLLPFFDNRETPFLTASGISRKRVHIATKLDLYSSNLAGLGWDCGYRNIQIMFSAMLYNRELHSVLERNTLREVPSIPEIAARIEEAWKKGYDKEGASNFEGKLIDKEVWIGATEAVVLFRSLGINALISDFETPTDLQRRVMFEWIYNQFEQWCGGRNCSIHQSSRRSTSNAALVMPMFCQWQGHSVTIVGAVKSRLGDVSLLVLDPSRGFQESISKMSTLHYDLFKREVTHHQMQHPRFQLVFVPSFPLNPRTSDSGRVTNNDDQGNTNYNNSNNMDSIYSGNVNASSSANNETNSGNGNRNGGKGFLRSLLEVGSILRIVFPKRFTFRSDLA